MGRGPVPCNSGQGVEGSKEEEERGHAEERGSINRELGGVC